MYIYRPDERENFHAGCESRYWFPSGEIRTLSFGLLQDATSVLDAFHIAELTGDALNEVLRCVQQDTLGHRGRKSDPLYQIRFLLRASHDRLTKHQQARLATSFAADETHICVEGAYQCARQVREVFHQDTLTQGRLLDARLIKCLPTCPIHEIARMGRTLRRRKDAFLAYFDTVGASNGIIKLGRPIARGYRNLTSYNSKSSSSQEA